MPDHVGSLKDVARVTLEGQSELEDKISGLEDKLKDILDKCEDIFEKVSEK